MKVTIKFSETLSKTVDLDFAWELFYLYQQGARKAGENITPEREADWKIVERQLQEAEEGVTIDFTLMGDIYFENER